MQALQYYPARVDFCGNASRYTGRPTPPFASYHHRDAALSLPQGVLGQAITSATPYSGRNYPAIYRGSIWFTDHPQGWIQAVWPNAARTESRGTTKIMRNLYSVVSIEQSNDAYGGDLFFLNLQAGQLVRLQYDITKPYAEVTLTIHTRVLTIKLISPMHSRMHAPPKVRI